MGSNIPDSSVSVAAATAVAILTAGALALRLAELDQTLFGDEVFTYRIVTRNDFWGIFGDVSDTAITPPLHYALAWLAVQVGDPTVTIRIPSLVLGTATVPLAYVLGLRTVGREAGLVGSAILAISPFAIFYGVEARAYASLAFLSVLATLALISALRRDRALSWLAYGMSAVAIVYTHYSGVFVLMGQVGWALWAHRDRAWHLVLVSLGVVVAYMPWLPSYFAQDERGSDQAERFAGQFPLTAETIADTVGHVLPGYPLVPPGHSLVPLSELPGRSGVAIVWATIGAALIAATARAVHRRRTRGSFAARPAAVLVVALALATPLGLVLYSAQSDTSLLLPRNLSASVPAFALLVGWLLTSLRPPFALAAVGLVLAALAVGTVEALDDDNRRAPYREVARFIEADGRAGDGVINKSAALFDIGIFFPERAVFRDWNEPEAWTPAAHGGSVFVVAPQGNQPNSVPPLAGPGYRVPLRERRLFPGRFPLVVGRYAGEVTGWLGGRAGHRFLTWSLGSDVPISPSAARGIVESVSRPGRGLTLSGWAIGGSERQIAEWVLAFRGQHLVGVGRPGNYRPDVAKAYGGAGLVSGFTISTRSPHTNGLPVRFPLRVLALAGGQASGLAFSKAARNSLDRGPQ